MKRNPQINNELTIKEAKKTGSKELRDLVIQNNIPLVLKLAKKWKNRGSKEELNDLYSMGLLGLVVAYDNFDTNKNLMFSTYSTKVIWNEFCKKARSDQMKCRSNFNEVSMEEIVPNRIREITYSEILHDEDSLNNYERIDNNLLGEFLFKSIESFTDKEKYITKRHFFDGESLVDISRELNVSRQAIHQGYKRSIRRLESIAQQ